MIKIGDYNELKVTRLVDFGAYLSDGQTEILLPKRYVNPEMSEGTPVKCFVYTDSEDRPVATTEHPFAKVGEFAFLQTIEVNRVGAFMDWGLAKNLLVPFKEQKLKMFPGAIYLVYVYLDHNTGRVVASARIERFLDNVFPEYEKGEKVKALVIGHNDIGYKIIVDNLHSGIIYKNEVFRPVEIGALVTAYVKNVREDGKIDVTLSVPDTLSRIDHIAEEIVRQLKTDTMTVKDGSSPEEIKVAFQCSKKDFKKAVGLLYRNHKISIDSDGTLMLV